METTDKSARQLEADIALLMARFLEAVKETEAPSVLVSVALPGQDRSLSFMAGNSSSLCAMILYCIQRLSPEDFKSVLTLMATAPDFELHRHPPKEGMVN